MPTTSLVQLIGSPAHKVEFALALAGLRNAIEADTLQPVTVYGCGVFTPGYEYDKLVKAHARGELKAVLGLTLEEHELDRYLPELRDLLGRFLKLAPIVMAADELSGSGLPHFGCPPQHGGHPGWLADEAAALAALRNRCLWTVADHPLGFGTSYVVCQDNAENVADPDSDQAIAVVAVDDLGVAMAAAILQIPCLLYVDSSDHYNFHRQRRVLVRFATRWGCSHALVAQEEDWAPKLKLLLQGSIAPLLSADALARARQEAEQTMDKLFEPPVATASDVAATIQGIFGVRPAAAKNPRRIELGSVLDPSTHYGPEYYGEGAGLLFTRPSGKEDIYHGPAHEWEGFGAAAEILADILPAAKFGRSLLSIGCGSGCDVRHFQRRGWDAYGVDLSSAAIERASPDARDRLFCVDVLDAEAFAKLPRQRFHLILALDFWEHIWTKDLESLARRCHDLLEPGGVFFNIICTHGKNEREFVAAPGVRFTKENSEILVSGHVTVKCWSWWIGLFRKFGLQPRLDIAYLFQVRRTEDTSFRSALSWSARNLVVVERPRSTT